MPAGPIDPGAPGSPLAPDHKQRSFSIAMIQSKKINTFAEVLKAWPSYYTEMYLCLPSVHYPGVLDPLLVLEGPLDLLLQVAPPVLVHLKRHLETC